MYECGLRRGEAIGLLLIDLDGENNVLYVRQQITRVTGLVIRPPERGVQRSLTLGPQTAHLLRDHLSTREAEQAAPGPVWGESGLLFTTAEGAALDSGSVTHLMGRRSSKAKIAHATPHSLRHTHMTRGSATRICSRARATATSR